ncbi:Zn(2)-C6 fungal-type domain-containing protein [Favolaschia claudopus]|uniref:Zn(2)-C6 fungal-type domain-containing protein n=1 Tax=Favolaschia claudopus TaxID=2862362 RepID=A0AAW0EIQ8_9AGAR
MSRIPASQPTPEPGSSQVQLSRPFRSRKNRPCDGCRRAKSRCAIPQAGPPCVECQQMNKQCTFDELPPERKKPKPPASPAPNIASTSSHLPVEGQNLGKLKRPRSPDDGSAALQALSYAAAQEKRLRTGESEPMSLDLSISRSLDGHALTTLLTGMLSVAGVLQLFSTHTFADDLLPIGTKQAGPDDNPLSETPYIRQISGDRSKPQYIIFTKKRNATSPSPGKKQQLALRASLTLFDPPISEDVLLDIYLGIFNAAFPLIYPDEPLDPILYTKLCLTALSHRRRYRSSVTAVRSIVRASEEDLRQEPSRLSTISGALLDLSARPVLDVEDNYVLLAKTIAEAQLLGLHIDCSSWNIPTWEKELRRSLWWGLRIHDAWMCFLNSRPSHIQNDNHSTPLPDIVDGSSPSNSSDTTYSSSSFVYLCRLSVLCSRLQSQVCTLASSFLLPAERLAKVKPIEEETQMLLVEVRRHDMGRSSASGVASLMTCLLGFRCMLRRISIELSIGLGSPFTPDPATLEMYAEAVDYICNFDARSFDGFWLNYVGHILSSITSSLIRLSLATSASVPSLSPQRPPITIQASTRTMPLIMLSRLQRALQAARHDYSWDLAEPALNRAESVINCLKSSSEYTSVVAALKGSYEPEIPPANGNMSQKSNGVHEAASNAVDYGWNIDLNAFDLNYGANNEFTGIWAPAPASESQAIPSNIMPIYTE